MRASSRRAVSDASGEDLVLLDFGTTATRLVHARLRYGARYTILRQKRLPIRLASGALGTLSPAAIRAVLERADRFLGAAGDGRARRLAIATAAVREARNAERLRQALRRRGISLRVLSAETEGRLSALAALRATRTRTALVADLGGGSLELTRAARGRMKFLASLPLGAVRLTGRFLHHDPPLPAEMAALRADVRRQLGPVLAPVGRATVVGVGGTVRALTRMARAGDSASERGPGWLNGREVSALGSRLARLSLRRRRKLRGLRRDRADIIVAGAVVIEELMTLAGVRRLRIAQHGLRHGLLLEETFGRRERP